MTTVHVGDECGRLIQPIIYEKRKINWRNFIECDCSIRVLQVTLTIQIEL